MLESIREFTVSDLEYSYGGEKVLGGISFDARPGEVLGILGTNGAGKSTLLKCINKILVAEKGGVSWCGQDILSMGGGEIAKCMAYVPQSCGDTAMTVYEMVLLGRMPHINWSVSPEDHSVVEDIILSMGLEQFSGRRVDELSGGEVQKVVIARAMAQEPDILLLDEPTSCLDLKNQFEVMNLVRGIVRKKKIIALVILHDLNLALRFSHRLMMIKDGSVYCVTGRDEITEEMIASVYGIEVKIDGIAGHKVVVPA